MKGVARAKIQVRIDRQIAPLRESPSRATGEFRKLSTHSRVKAESAAARLSVPNAPIRNFIDSAEANSVAVQSLIVSSDVSVSGKPCLRKRSIRFVLKALTMTDVST